MGSSLAISSPMVYSLENGEDGGLKMTTEEASWIRKHGSYRGVMIPIFPGTGSGIGSAKRLGIQL